MEEERIYGLSLLLLPGVGNVTLHKLLDAFGSPKEVWLGQKYWHMFMQEGQCRQALAYAKANSPKEQYETFLKSQMKLAFFWEADFPRRMLQMPDVPVGLFYSGELPADDVPSVAIIGARDCSGYGEFVASQLGGVLGEAGVQVISGMARGIDGISQSAALEAGGKSFGILGCGVDVCYPKQNRALYQRLQKQGGVISTYPPGTAAAAGHFPPRNRIVSGFADALVVIEAKSKSGTLITVDMALEQGKEVYALPGRVCDRLSDGCNWLIKQGAGVLLSPTEFLRELEAVFAAAKERYPIAGTEPAASESLLRGRPVTIREALSAYQNAGPGLAEEERERIYQRLLKENPMKAALFYALEHSPLSVEALAEKAHVAQLSFGQVQCLLMALLAEGYAGQASPGTFLRAR